PTSTFSTPAISRWTRPPMRSLPWCEASSYPPTALDTRTAVAETRQGDVPMNRMAELLTAAATACGLPLSLWTAHGQAQDSKAAGPQIDATSFRCIRTMTAVRQFYVDNLLGRLDATLAVANSKTGGAYPPGSVIQLIPGEAMVKRDQGFNPATRDWEF